MLRKEGELKRSRALREGEGWEKGQGTSPRDNTIKQHKGQHQGTTPRDNTKRQQQETTTKGNIMGGTIWHIG
jgi:hypothetical protein